MSIDELIGNLRVADQNEANTFGSHGNKAFRKAADLLELWKEVDIPDSIPPTFDVPEKIHEAAQTLQMFFAMAGMEKWQFQHVADRNLVSQLLQERNALQCAIMDFKRAKGRHNTQQAAERLISLLPE